METQRHGREGQIRKAGGEGRAAVLVCKSHCSLRVLPEGWDYPSLSLQSIPLVLQEGNQHKGMTGLHQSSQTGHKQSSTGSSCFYFIFLLKNHCQCYHGSPDSKFIKRAVPICKVPAVPQITFISTLCSTPHPDATSILSQTEANFSFAASADILRLRKDGLRASTPSQQLHGA